MKHGWQIVQRLLGIGMGLSLGFQASSTKAAEWVLLKYKIHREDIAVSELTTLAETGEVSPSLQFYFDYADQDPQTFRLGLRQEIYANFLVLDKALNSAMGETVLDQLSKVIHTPSGKADRQALRAAIILSAREDNKVSLIEILQNYPTKEVQLEGNQIVAIYKQLKLLEAWIPFVSKTAQLILQNAVETLE